MRDELDVRVVRALRAEADSPSVTVTPEQIEERLSRSAGPTWLAPAAAALGLVALVLAVSFGLASPKFAGVGNEPLANHQLQLWPDQPLPAPYDWDGVREALRPRGLLLERPTEADAARVSVDVNDMLTAVEQQLADEPRATMVSVHIGVVTREPDGRGPQMTRELVYVVETTGHPTGNCFDLRSPTGEGSILGACFYSNRSMPRPSVTELPTGTWVSNSAFRSGSICLALEVADPMAESHSAWWWNPGGSGDCSSRSSSVTRAAAATDEVPLVRVELPVIPEQGNDVQFETLSLRFTGYTEDGFELHGVPFRQVDDVDPLDWPTDGDGPAAPTAAASPGNVGEPCVVTQPDPPFVPPSPYPAVAPPLYEADWYGSEALWTMLDRDGEVWGPSAINLGEKTFWWSLEWPGMRDAPQPGAHGRWHEAGRTWHLYRRADHECRSG